MCGRVHVGLLVGHLGPHQGRGDMGWGSTVSMWMGECSVQGFLRSRKARGDMALEVRRAWVGECVEQ